MKILVTGGAGFIGSNVVDAYIKAGHEVAVADNLFTGKRENINPKARFYEVDIRSKEFSGVLEAERPDIVNHHAAQMSVPASVIDPVFDADVNVLGLLNMLQASVKTGVKKVIFISSGGTVYGDTEALPSSEEQPLKPASPYGITKAVAERYLEYYRRHFSLDYTVLRYGNIYGPRQVAHGEASVVSIFMGRLMENEPCVIYRFDGQPGGMTRDYCYVDDAAAANLLVLENGGGEAFNIGTGVETDTLGLFEKVYCAVSHALPGLSPGLGSPATAAARPGELRRVWLDVGKALRTLGWKSEISLEKGVENTLKWRIKGLSKN